ncbi:DUF1439 domain-containing protein [Paraburkholderia bonniea]|uniref:DUF1439 domain-containing protein n=1 Tax=Paraburkholderia bonniea TaxID=2152891 RepID=UPI001291373B|nr:DUF1439 domain-containing protein [Paraburkholderia bonniea]WJF90903.1 DUF1439 domain-containing protein [Paraburkholderia bonniea]WJF94217.1 DUF1439 domain-containing protein [Paraburkholderia bonniea]
MTDSVSVAPGRRGFLLAAMVAAATVGAVAPWPVQAVSIFPFMPKHYTFSQQQVLAAVQRKFPYQRTVSQVFEIALTNPVVGFLADSNRVSVRLDIRLASPFLTQPVAGVFTLTSQLAYDSTNHAVVLKSPTVENVSLDGQGQAYTQQVSAAAAMLSTQLLDNYPVYTFKPEQLQFAGVNYEPGTITVLTNGIRVEIVEK